MTHDDPRNSQSGAKALTAKTGFYSVNQVAAYLAVHPRTVKRWIKSKALRAHEFGRIRISSEDLASFIALRRR